MGLRFNPNIVKKSPMDEDNEQFMEASKQATDEYLTQNQNNPMAFMDVLKGSILPPQKPQIPFAPEQEQLESIETFPEDNQVRDIASVEESPVNPALNLPNVANYDRILNELRKMREGSEKDIQSSRDIDKDNASFDNVMKGASKIADAFANRSGITKIKTIPNSVKTDYAERAEGDRKRKLEDLMNEYKMIAGKDNAAATRAYREAMLKMQQNKEERADKYLDEKQKTENRVARQQQINTARGFLKDDKRYQKLQEQSMAFDGIKNSLEAAKGGNQAAVSALGSQLARAMGEVGVLTDTDVTRYLGSTSWGRKLKDWAAKGFEGELSRDTLKDIQNNIGNIEKAIRNTEDKVFKGAADRMKQAYPTMEDNDIYGVLGYNPKSSIPPVGTIINKAGKKYRIINDNGDLEEIK